jgi:hypothetical protein
MESRLPDRPAKNTEPPTDQEWDAFLTHFEKRKVSLS